MHARRALHCLAGAALLLGPAACRQGTARDGGPGDYEARLAREHRGDRPVSAAAGAVAVQESVAAEPALYARVAGVSVEGYLAHPPGRRDSLPGVILIHEWWGLNDNIRTMARSLAARGYLALAVDLMGGEVAESPERARELVGRVSSDPEAAWSNLRQAYAYLKEARRAPRVGVIGWCFGGGWALQTALGLPSELNAAVIYYGRLETDPSRLEPLAVPVLGIFGAEDTSIPVETVRRFEAVLDSLGKEVEVRIYEGAGHAFANPSGTRYRAEAAADAWARTLAFLRRHLTP